MRARNLLLRRARRFDGAKFRRQHSIGAYVLDFYCPELRLDVEIDGDQHRGAELHHDAVRDAFLEAFIASTRAPG